MNAQDRKLVKYLVLMAMILTLMALTGGTFTAPLV